MPGSETLTVAGYVLVTIEWLGKTRKIATNIFQTPTLTPARGGLTSRAAPMPTQPATSAQTLQRPAITEAGGSARPRPSGATSRPQATPPGTGGPPRHTHPSLPLPAGTPPLLTISLKEQGKGYSPELSPGR